MKHKMTELRGKKTERYFIQWCTNSSGYTCQRSAKLKPRARNYIPISHMHGRDPVTCSTTLAFPGALVRDAWKWSNWSSNLCSNTGCWGCKQQLNLSRHSPFLDLILSQLEFSLMETSYLGHL